MLFIALHQFWDSAFAQKVEPIFLQLDRFREGFWYGFATFQTHVLDAQGWRRLVLYAVSIRVAVHRPYEAQVETPGSHPPRPPAARDWQAEPRLQRQAVHSLRYPIAPPTQRSACLHSAHGQLPISRRGWLRQTLPAPHKETTARPEEAFAKWRYIVPTAAVGLAVAATLVGPRLIRRLPETPRAPSIALEPPRVQPTQEQNAVTPQTGAKISKGGLVQGEVVHQVLPRVPQKARDTIRGTVRVSVRVSVDPSGSVVGAKVDSPGPSKYFTNLALRAARRWKFRSPKVDGRDVSSEWTLRFGFARTATKILLVQASP
jgi:TonB family protein